VRGRENTRPWHQVSNPGSQLIQPSRPSQINFVQEHDVRRSNLVLDQHRIEIAAARVLGVHHRNDSIYLGPIAKLGGPESCRHAKRIGDAAGLNHNVLRRVGPGEHLERAGDQITLHGAADAAVREIDRLAPIGDRVHQAHINVDGAEVVDQNPDPPPAILAQDAIQQRGLPRTQKAGQDGDGSCGV
jgi:hypothetical protein